MGVVLAAAAAAILVGLSRWSGALTLLMRARMAGPWRRRLWLASRREGERERRGAPTEDDEDEAPVAAAAAGL